MLALTRRVGQSVTVGHDVIVTLESIMDGRTVAVRIVRARSSPKSIILSLGESWVIAPGVTITNLRDPRNRESMTRLGFVAPQAVGIYRSEVPDLCERYGRKT